MNKKNQKIISMVLVLIMLIFAISTISYASKNNQKFMQILQVSEAHKQWENLNEQEKENKLEPAPYEINFKNGIRKSRLNSLLSESLNDDVGEKYDLRTELGNNIIVKNQNKVGACWAFSYTNMLETTMAHKYNKTGIEYSPMHLDYQSSKTYNRKTGSGGNIVLSLAYSASGYGPVLERDLPFNSVYNEQTNSADNYYLSDISTVDLNKSQAANIKDATLFASIYKSYGENEIKYKDSSALVGYTPYSQEEVNAIRKMIKKHIKENGAVTGAFYVDLGLQFSGESNYFNKETNAYYYPNVLSGVNHAVTIVGWDDNYSKNNFKEENRPINDGAYIVLNSWGTQWGENGYYYVSYDDAAIEQMIYGVSKIEEIDNTVEEKKYEYDPLGMTLDMLMVNDEGTQYLDSGYAANVFTRDQISNKEEYLSEVGLFLTSAEGVEIYVNAEDDNLNKGELVATYTGSNALEAGYHRIKLASPVKLTGTKFIVKVKYINSEKTFIPMECNIVDSGVSDDLTMYNTAKSNPGESFVSKDGTGWSDLYNYVYGPYTIKNTNFCIKAFSTLSEKSSNIETTGIELNKESATINVNETVSLVATVKPENATNKNVIWSSDNENIATVNGGVVKGISEGMAIITAKTQDGKFSATCNITVEGTVQDVVNVTGIELNKSEDTINVGNTTALIATVKPENATNKNVVWISGNDEIATVENGVVTGISEGKTIITAKTEDGNYIATCDITVNLETEIKHVEKVELEKTEYTIQEGENLTIAAIIAPLDATNKSVLWSSSDESIATISPEGIIKAIKPGKVTITVTTLDGNFKAYAELTVTAKTSSEDDIYKEDDNNTTGGNTEIEDNTTSRESYSVKIENSSDAPSVLPYTGVKEIVLVLIFMTAIGITVCYRKYNKMKDIK